MNRTNLSLFDGLIASDGHLDKDYNGIRFITSNKEFLYDYVLKLVKSYNPKIWKTKSGFGKDRYILYIYNKGLKELLENNYCILRGKKSENIDLPKNISFEDKLSFIKGLFSGDGSISFDKKLDKKYPQIIFWSKSKNLIFSLKEFFEKINIKSGLSYTKSKNQYRLIIRERNSLIMFNNVQKKDWFYSSKEEGSA